MVVDEDLDLVLDGLKLAHQVGADAFWDVHGEFEVMEMLIAMMCSF